MSIPGGWAFGTYGERQRGGYPVRMVWDSVLPYSLPFGDHKPGWWEDAVQRGQFWPDGWQRNHADVEFDENGKPLALVPNFPADRHLNAVGIATLGLRQSTAPAPFRLHAVDQNGRPVFRDDDQWPFETQGELPVVPALEVLEWYIEHGVAAELKLIIQLPERDVINALAKPNDFNLPEGWEPAQPDNAAGEAALYEFVQTILIPEAEGGMGLLSRVIAWYNLDEPDTIGRLIWAKPERLARLRAIIKKAELAVRREFEEGFADLSEEEQFKRLNPCIVTVTTSFFLDFDPFDEDLPGPERLKAAQYIDDEGQTWCGAADIYGFDWYPFKRSTAEIRAEYPPECPEDTPDELYDPHFLKADPVRSLRAFRQLRHRLNANAMPGESDYIPVFAWQQLYGDPFFREPVEPPDPGTTPVSAQTAPGGAVARPTTCESAPRIARFPSLEEMRFYNWAAWLGELSEGTVGFAQFGAPDIRLKEDFAKVAAETEFFAGLRHGFRSRAAEITWRDFSRDSFRDDRDLMPPMILFGDYVNAPRGGFLGCRGKTWLILINRDYVTRVEGFQFGFPDSQPRLFEKVDFLKLTGESLLVRPLRTFLILPLEPYSVNIYHVRHTSLPKE